MVKWGVEDRMVRPKIHAIPNAWQHKLGNTLRDEERGMGGKTASGAVIVTLSVVPSPWNPSRLTARSGVHPEEVANDATGRNIVANGIQNPPLLEPNRPLPTLKDLV